MKAFVRFPRLVSGGLLRFAPDARGDARRSRPFRVEARSMGLREELAYDDVAALVERVEGPAHR